MPVFRNDIKTALHDFNAKPLRKSALNLLGIFEACENAGTPVPVIDYKPNELWLGFPFAPEFLKAIATPEVTAPVTPQVTPQVSALLAALDGEHSREELQERLELADRENFRKSYLLPALKEKLIERTIPEKPNSRLQKYRLTEKGRSLLH